jgi:hypothetical protein
MEEEEEGEFVEFTLAMTNDLDTDTAVVIQMAALMLNNDGPAAYLRALEIPLSDVGSTLVMATSIIATMAEHLAEHEDTSADVVLLEMRNWMNEPGEEEDDE